jgi:hypothetical protein
MPLRYLLDEHLRGLFWKHVRQYNARTPEAAIDVVRVGDPDDLPLGSSDPDIIAWCEREARVLVSMDRRTLPVHLARHLSAGGHSPGIFLIREVPINVAVEFLALADVASEPSDWQGQIHHIPF